ncbi:MAG: hypothetical protein GMKNLPBB_03232 [Myxococcota bacterium]|nr:hypothetical protein [Myxococcota bacterium]
MTSNVPETPCTKYDVEQMRLVGIITGVASPRAYAELPDASLGCYMKIGTDVGKHGGKVIAITRKGVRIRERYGRPSSGPVPVNLYVLKLQEEEPMSGVPGEDEGPPQLVDDRGAWLGGGQRGTRPGPGSPGGGTAGESRFVGPDGKEYVIKQTVVGGTPPPAQGQGDGQQQDARPVWQRRVDAPAPPPPPSAPSPPPPPPPSGIFPGGAQDYGSPTPD